jgi:hypothetical protein
MPFFADQSREQLRRLYVDTWRKFRTNKPLEPLEAQLAELIAEHPDYHAMLEVEDSTSAEFPVEAGRENPFLHLGLHLAIREQVATDRPAGIAAAHSALARKLGSVHEAEHRILEVLGEMLWEAQRNGVAPEERAYLERVRRL